MASGYHRQLEVLAIAEDNLTDNNLLFKVYFSKHLAPVIIEGSARIVEEMLLHDDLLGVDVVLREVNLVESRGFLLLAVLF